MTAMDKWSLISESVTVIRIGVHHAGEEPNKHSVRVASRVSYPGSKKHRTEASIRVPRMFNHTHSNNVINR
jgi:hypothetical protein